MQDQQSYLLVQLHSEVGYHHSHKPPQVLNYALNRLFLDPFLQLHPGKPVARRALQSLLARLIGKLGKAQLCHRQDMLDQLPAPHKILAVHLYVTAKKSLTDMKVELS
ncbi:MAG: Uncharacterised protein [SAR116 cluster bacterium]|nr:MAG: Uncharacterised protein [SAR116 cluster bacterium]